MIFEKILLANGQTPSEGINTPAPSETGSEENGESQPEESQKVYETDEYVDIDGGTFIHFVTGKFLLLYCFLYCFPKILPESFLPHCCFHLLKAAGPRPLYHHPDQPPAVPAH